MPQDYKKLLEEEYREHKLSFDDCTKFDFIANNIFNFTTYDEELDEIFSKKMIEVLVVIMNRTNFDYIKNRDNYIQFITMVNMPFLVDKLECGTSIRGAWLDESKEYEIIGTGINVKKDELKLFISHLIIWSNEP